MYRDVDRILYTREVIEERVKELAGQVVGVYREEPFVVVVALQGAFVFAADLVRHLPQAIEIVFVHAASYGDRTSATKPPVIEIPPKPDLAGRHVLLVEDIVDSGRTVAALTKELKKRKAASVRICSFLDKPARRKEKVDVEFIGFSLPGDAFVIGYGLDFAGRYRNLPFVGTLKQQEDSKAKSPKAVKVGARSKRT
jgi:hypoxanthine phosphoribosyltransferase